MKEFEGLPIVTPAEFDRILQATGRSDSSQTLRT